MPTVRDLLQPSHELSRRHVLGAGLAASAALLTRGLADDAPPPAAPPAAAPRRLKLSLAAYSYRDYLTGKLGQMTLDEFIQLCSDYELDGCELTSYYFPKDFKDDYLLHLKQLTFKLGLDVSGTAIGNDFCLPPGPAREAQLAAAKRWIDHAALFGAPVIRIFAGGVPAGLNEETAREYCVAGINEAVEYAALKGVFLALENHGGITATPEQMLKIVEAVKPSPWFGVNFDSGNFRTADPYADLAKIAPYAINAQVKVDMYPGGKHEPADLERIVGILRDANYRGYVVLEYEAKADPKTAIPGHLKTLRKLLS